MPSEVPTGGSSFRSLPVLRTLPDSGIAVVVTSRAVGARKAAKYGYRRA